MTTQLQGKYRARATIGALSVSAKGNEQVVVEFAITEEGPEVGRRITWWGHFTEKTADRTIESLRHMGWEGDMLDDLTGIDQNEVELDIIVEEYTDRNGEVCLRSRVNWVNRPGSLVLKGAMDAGQAHSFAQRMRARTMQGGGTRPTAAKPQPRPAPKLAPAPQNRGGAAPRQEVEDDIPFAYNATEICATRPPRWIRW